MERSQQIFECKCLHCVIDKITHKYGLVACRQGIYNVYVISNITLLYTIKKYNLNGYQFNRSFTRSLLRLPYTTELKFWAPVTGTKNC